MPLLGNFVVKHIRPFGEAGYNAFGNDQTIEFLSSLGLSGGDIASIFAAASCGQPIPWGRAAFSLPPRMGWRRRGGNISMRPR